MMDVAFHVTWNYLLYPLAAFGLLTICVLVWASRQSW